MARSKMTEQLDNITYSELGVPFDEGLIWEKLDARLGDAPRYMPFRWMLAAAIFLGVLFLPLTVLKEDQPYGTMNALSENQNTIVQQVDAEEVPMLTNTLTEPSSQGSFYEVRSVDFRKVELKVASIASPTFTRVEYIPPVEQEIRPQFAVEDISVIQASLENASINDRRKGRTMSIRAQGQTSLVDEVDETYQAIKIKLYEQKN